MRLIKKLDAPSSFRLKLLSDFHHGSAGSYDAGIDSVLDEIRHSESVFFANLGDSVDAVCTDDKRYRYEEGVPPIPLRQCAHMKDKHAPVADKCWALLKGNHEDKLHRFGDIVQDLIAGPLGIPYGGYTCKLAVHDKFGLLFKLYLWHGPLRGTVTSNAKDHTQRLANMQAAVRRYLENKASDCAVMAMGHCFDEETEILTSVGWKRHTDLELGSLVMTLNRDTGFLEYNPVEQIHRYEGYDQLISAEGKSCSLAVTPEHGLWACTGNSGSGSRNSYREEKASEAEGKLRIMRCSGEMAPDTPGLPLSDPQIGFLAWLMAEGYLGVYGGSEHVSTIRIAQSDAPDGRLRVLLECCDACGLDYLLSRRYVAGSSEETKNGIITRHHNAYSLAVEGAKEVAAWVTKYLSCEKNVLNVMWGMNSHQAKVFLSNYKRADGHEYKPGSWQTSSVRKDHADFLQGLMIKAGMRGTMSYNQEKGDNGCYTISVTPRTEVTIGTKLWSRVPYKGTVWCASVKNKTLVVRRRGKHLITMNTHKLLINPPAPKLLLSDNGDELKHGYLGRPRPGETYLEPDRRWYVNTGSYLRSQVLGHDSYAEIAGYDPIELGHVEIVVEDRVIVDVRKMVAE